MTGDEDRPGCFGEVNTPQKYLEARGVEYKYDCKECRHLTECIKEYNENAYEHWIEEPYFMTEEEWMRMEHRDYELCDYDLADRCIDPSLKSVNCCFECRLMLEHYADMEKRIEE